MNMQEKWLPLLEPMRVHQSEMVFLFRCEQCFVHRYWTSAPDSCRLQFCNSSNDNGRVVVKYHERGGNNSLKSLPEKGNGGIRFSIWLRSHCCIRVRKYFHAKALYVKFMRLRD